MPVTCVQGSGRLDGDFIDGRLNTSSAEKPANPLGLYHRKETRMLIARLCSWCGRSLPPKECKDPCSGKLTHPVTHTICAECFEKAMDDILSTSAKPIKQQIIEQENDYDTDSNFTGKRHRMRFMHFRHKPLRRNHSVAGHGVRQSDARMWVAGKQVEVAPTAQRLLSNRLRVPYSYLSRCPAELQARNLNYWIEQERQQRGDLLLPLRCQSSEGGVHRSLLPP
jgi:hypothetical protein